MATRIGGWEAVVLQQIHYWLEINRESGNNFQDGHYWTFNSYENWQKQFPWLSVKKIKRVIGNLEKMNLLISDNFNSLKIDRTKWYRINYEAVESLELISGNGRDKMGRSMAQNVPMGVNKGFQGSIPLKGSPESLDFMDLRIRMANALEAEG